MPSSPILPESSRNDFKLCLHPPVAGIGLIFFNNKTFQMNARRFHVLVINAVIADQRIRHGDDLTFIGGIGNHFLITGHACIEDDFPQCFACARKGKTLKDTAVFQDQQGLDDFFLTGAFNLNLQSR